MKVRFDTQTRAAAMVASGALAVHELRYLLVYGGDAQAALAHHGHIYLGLVTSAVAGLLALILSRLIVGIARGGSKANRRTPVSRIWFASALALLVVYGAQAFAEGVLAPDHLEGLGTVFDQSGLVALPLALGGGGLIALGLRGARALKRLASLSRPSLRAIESPARLALDRARESAVTPLTPLARYLGGRAPPLSFA